ncbi:MAG: N-acetyltransferase [Firmicutes bacterium]|nr:N-acetyltransferase [Bacillota bacterium]
MKYIIQHQPNRFWMEDHQHQLIGEIEYHLDQAKRYVVTHTFVNPSYRGQGLANQLLDQIITLARKEKKYIYPICSFAVKVLQHPQYRDLWDPKEGEPNGGACTWVNR